MLYLFVGFGCGLPGKFMVIMFHGRWTLTCEQVGSDALVEVDESSHALCCIDALMHCVSLLYFRESHMGGAAGGLNDFYT